MKKILTILLSVAMVLCMMPGVAFANSQSSADCDATVNDGNPCTHVASMGDKHYDTLNEAIENAPLGTQTTIKLLNNTKEVVTINTDKKIVLDLNGKVWTSETQSILYGSLTIEDTSIEGTGEITNGNVLGLREKATIKVETNTKGADAASLTLNSGTIKTVQSERAAVYVNGGSTKASGIFNMNGGKLISANGGTTSAALYGFGYSYTEINGGTIQNNDENYAVYCTANASLIIKDGEFIGKTHAVTKKNCEISGGKYIEKPFDGDATVLADGYIFAGDDTNGWQVVQGNLTEDNAGASLTIGDETTYYNTGRDALAVLGTQTGTVKLLRDESNTLAVNPGTNATLDLNGKTLLGHIDVKSNANLTIKDSTEVKEPVLSDDYNTVTYDSGKIYTSYKYAVKVEGTLNVESGTIINKGSQNDDFGNAAGIVAYNGGKVNIKGGYVEAQEFGTKVFGNGSEVVLSGGIVNSKNNAALGGFGVDEGFTSIKVTGGIAVGHIEKDGYVACGIYNPQPGTVEISGGQVIAVNGVGVLVRDGELNVTDGKVMATGTASGKVGDAEVQIPASGIFLDNVGKVSENTTVTVTGGNVIADPSQKALASEGTVEDSQIKVSGGNFTSKVDNAYCAENYAPIVQEDGTYTVVIHTHNLIKTESKAPTCGANGNIAYWYCEECDTYFKDEALTNEITVAETVIAATGEHNYKDGSCTVCGKTDPNYKPPTPPSTGGGYVPPVDKAVNNVKDLINAIGDVTIEDEAAIQAARDAYDKLTDAQKAKVDNYKALTDAEAAIEAIKADIAEKEEIAKIKGMKLAARSLATKAPSGKKAIRIQWYESKDGTLTKLDKGFFDKVEIYRATKKGAFGSKPIYTSKSDRYYNTSIKKGKRYYYAVVGVKTIGGEEVRTEMSLMAIRTAK